MEQQNTNVDNTDNNTNNQNNSTQVNTEQQQQKTLSPQKLQENVIKKLQNREDPATFPPEEQQIARQIIEQSHHHKQYLDDTISKIKNGKITQKELKKRLQDPNIPNEIKQKIIDEYEGQARLSDIERFNKETKQQQNRIIRMGDTESSPEDLEQILRQNFNIAGEFNKKTDIVIHAGDLLQDLIDFKNLHHGSQGFLSDRIIKSGGLEGEVAQEFKEAYLHLLEKNGVNEYQLKKGEMNENIKNQLVRLYYGIEPQFLTQQKKEEYKKQFQIFQKHMTTAIKNDARNKYIEYKNKFEKYGLTPEDLIIMAGNHDVPEVMQEVLGKYMTKPGKVITRKGLDFTSPVSGSTGQVLGPEFNDIFGSTDMREKLETIQQNTPEFQKFLNKLNKYGINADKKKLTHLINISQARLANGVGEGYLVKYFDSRTKKHLDTTIEDMRGQMITKVPKADFYLFHGQPNHHSYAGLEERAAYDAIEKEGGNIIHGHIHGKTTHKMGKSLLLNEGDGKSNFGVYHYDKKEKKVTDIFSKVYNSTLGQSEFEYIKPEQLGVRQDNAQQGQ